MAFLTGGANTLATGDFVTNSLRISPSDDGFLERTTSGVADSNRKTWTFSWWAKLNATGLEQHLYSFRVNADNMSYLRLNSDGQMRWANEDYNQPVLRVQTNRYFRDPNAWYHIVLRADTTQSTEADRIRFYINGVQETSMSVTDYPSQNYDLEINQADSFVIGASRNTNGTTTGQVDGYLSEVHFVDGQSYAPTVFGEYNDNGVWIPKDCKADITYGTRGFYMQFKETGTSANSSGMGADTSGNDNHFTPNNLVAADITTDTPMNNFCTWNPLANKFAGSTFSEGNCYLTMADSVSTFNTGTFGLTSGKWYWETKVINIGSGSDNFLVGAVSRPDSTGTSDYLGESTSVVFRNNGQIKKDSSNATHGASYGANDIVMVALDCDNNNIYFGENGQWADGSGNNDESSINSAVSFTSTMVSDGIVFPAQGDLHGNTPNPIASTNFGNAPHSISSGNTDENGYGNFEYEPPSGYFALCTKNLAEYG